MKREMHPAKRFLANVLVIAIIACLLPVPHAQAAKKPAVKSISIKNGSKTVTGKTITLTAGKSTSLKVTVKPAKAKKSVAFKSSRPAIAKVTTKGKITAQKAGTAKITVTVRGKNGKKKTAYMKVKVKAKTIAVKSVTAKISNSQLTVGETARITAKVVPANASNRKLTYKSSDGNVAAVDHSGKVTAKKAGKAQITVTASNGKYARVSVTVKDKIIGVERVTADILPSAALLKGGTAQITAEVFPADATDKSLTYTSSDEAVAVVDNAGKVTAKNNGNAAITVSSGGKSADIQITVQEKYTVQTAEHIVTDGGDTIYGMMYRPAQEGKWPAVILSHGYNNNYTGFEVDCRLFAENGYIAYAYDFCGGSVTSRSSGKTTDMTIFTQKKNLLSVFEDIRKLDIVDSERIFLLGGSMGGLVTALAAEELSTQTAGMVLYFPALCVPDDWRKTYPTLEEIPETTEFWGMPLGKNFFTSIHEFDPYTVIGNYPNNILIIWGDRDPIVPRAYMDRAKEIYSPRAELIVVPGTEHNSSGAIFRESALSFMKGQQGGGM